MPYQVVIASGLSAEAQRAKAESEAIQPLFTETVWIASAQVRLAMTESLGSYAAFATAPCACLSIASMMSGHIRSGSA